MSIVAKYQIDRPQYAAAVDEFPGLRLVVEGMATSNCETISIVFWAKGTGFDAFETALRQIEEVTDVAVWSRPTDGWMLYRIRLPVAVTDYCAWAERGGMLLDCTLDDTGVVVRMRFPDRQSLIGYRRHCKEHGRSFELLELTDTNGKPEAHDALTSPQRALLTAALEGGYFEIPRETTMTDLAAQFHISDQAASERLRRALSNTLGGAPLDHHDTRIEAPLHL